MENINDNYYGRNTTIRLCELIILLEDNYDILKNMQYLVYEDMASNKAECLAKYNKILDNTIKYIL